METMTLAPMTGAEASRAQNQAAEVNSILRARKAESGQALNKDDFLKILITQLQNQDPTAPMEDKEFIAQMAQFSSLEQITNMSENFTLMARALGSGEAVNALGMEVDIMTEDGPVSGVVSSVSRGSDPMVRVNGTDYAFEDVDTIRVPSAWAAAAYDSASSLSTAANEQEVLP